MIRRGVAVHLAALGSLFVARAAAAFEPEEPSPPEPAPYFDPPEEPFGSFGDLRVLASYGLGSISSGSIHSDLAVRVHYQWSGGLPGVLWSLGFEFEFISSDLAHANSTLYLDGFDFGIGYGVPLTHNVQLELLPYVELLGAAIDNAFSNSVAWGWGFGATARAALVATLDSGLQMGLAGSYSLRTFVLNGDTYNGNPESQLQTLTLILGKRF
jgi:hypothetical protein